MPVDHHATIPTPRQTSPLRVLAGIACVAVTVAALAVAVLAVRTLSAVDRLDGEARGAASELRDASRELREAARGSAVTP